MADHDDASPPRRPAGDRDGDAQRFHALMEHATDVVLEIDRSGTVLYVSPNVGDLWGMGPETVLGTSVFEGIHPEDEARARRWLECGLTSFSKVGGRYRAILGDGEWHWLECTGRRYRNARGEDRGALVVRNVSEQKRLEDGLRSVAACTSGVTGEVFFQNLVEALVGALGVDFAFVAIVDEAGEHARTLAARGPEGPMENFRYPLRGSPCEEVLTGDPCYFEAGVQQRFPEDAELRQLGVEAYAGVPLRTTDGRALGLLNVMHRAPLPRPELVRALVPIFAARAASEFERLRNESELSRLAQVVEHASEGILVVDDGDVVRYANPAFGRITGLSPGRLLGVDLRRGGAERLGWSGFMGIGDALRRDGSWRGRVRAPRPDGSTLWVDCSAYVVPDEAKQTRHWVVSFADVTREVELEAQLRQSSKFEALGTLATGVAHGFNNLLSGILAYASLMRRGVEDRGRVADAAEVIERAALRAADLAEQLLGFAGRGSRREESVDLHAVALETTRLLERTFPRSIGVRLDLGASEPWVRGDPGQLQQVLMDLAINAREAMPRGGELSLTTQLDLDDPERPCVLLRVADTGTGIPADLLARVFEPFFTTKKPGEGSGMGLALAYGTVVSHGGRIQVKSEPGRGTVFEIRLPQSRRDLPADPPLQPVQGARNAKILVVDDDELVCRALVSLLQALGYRTETAADGIEALDRYRAVGDFDLVILDLDMPRMGGIDSLRELRRRDPGARVLMITGLGSQDLADRARAEGALDVLGKPYRMADISRAVARALGEPAD